MSSGSYHEVEKFCSVMKWFCSGNVYLFLTHRYCSKTWMTYGSPDRIRRFYLSEFFWSHRVMIHVSQPLTCHASVQYVNVHAMEPHNKHMLILFMIRTIGISCFCSKYVAWWASYAIVNSLHQPVPPTHHERPLHMLLSLNKMSVICES